MPRYRLTERAINKFKAPTETGKPAIYWDEGPRAVRGFGVLCSGKSASKVYVVQRDLPGGKTRRVTIAGVSEITLENARAAAANMAVNMRRGIDPKQQRAACATLRAALDAYTEARGHKLRPRSAENYHQYVTRHLADWLDLPLSDITRDMVEARHRQTATVIEARHQAAAAADAERHRARAAAALKAGWPEAAERHRVKAELAAARKITSGHATANAVMRSLRLLWNFAAERNAAMGPNPVRLSRQWFDVPRRDRLVRAEDLPHFYEALMSLPNPMHRDYLLLLLFTGLRRREAAALTWDDIDFRERVIRIAAHQTKARRRLDLPMSDVVHDLLVARRAIGKETFVFAADSASGHIAEPKFALAQVAAACGVHVSPHDLRRSFVTAAESAEISPLALRQLVNHSVGNDVTAGYIVMSIARLREAAQKVADRLKELCGIAPVEGSVALRRSWSS